MRHVVALLLVTALVLAGAWWIQHLVGAVTLQAGSYTVQAPLSVAVVSVLLFAALIYGVYRILDALFGLRHVARGISVRGARRKGEQAVTQTLVALAAREGQTAKQQVQRARQFLGDTPQTLFLAASAGTMAGDQAYATEAFEKLSTHRDGAFLGLRGLLSQAVAREDWVRASDLARQAEKVRPGAGWLRSERSDYAARSGDWQEALLLNRDAAPHAALAAAAAEAESDPVRALKLAKDAFKRDPGLAAAGLAYARRLRESGSEKSAQDVLRKTWARSPQPDVAAMALAPSADRLARLKAGQALVRDAAESADSHFLLARLSLDAGLPDDARREAMAAERAGLKQRRLYLLMADIADAGGDDETHRAEAREALKRAAVAEPDPVWHCGACGSTLGTWHPACPNCHAVGRVRWTIPAPEVLAAE
jgi:HemY protein